MKTFFMLQDILAIIQNFSDSFHKLRDEITTARAHLCYFTQSEFYFGVFKYNVKNLFLPSFSTCTKSIHTNACTDENVTPRV